MAIQYDPIVAIKGYGLVTVVNEDGKRELGIRHDPMLNPEFISYDSSEDVAEVWHEASATNVDAHERGLCSTSTEGEAVSDGKPPNRAPDTATPDIQISEHVSVDNSNCTVSVTWTIKLDEMPADTAWRLGTDIMTLCQTAARHAGAEPIEASDGSPAGLYVNVDKMLCTGTGLCAELAPSVFLMGDDGMADVRHQGMPLSDADAELAIQAAEECPSECIHIEQVV